MANLFFNQIGIDKLSLENIKINKISAIDHLIASLCKAASNKATSAVDMTIKKAMDACLPCLPIAIQQRN